MVVRAGLFLLILVVGQTAVLYWMLQARPSPSPTPEGDGLREVLARLDQVAQQLAEVKMRPLPPAPSIPSSTAALAARVQALEESTKKVLEQLLIVNQQSGRSSEEVAKLATKLAALTAAIGAITQTLQQQQQQANRLQSDLVTIDAQLKRIKVDLTVVLDYTTRKH